MGRSHLAVACGTIDPVGENIGPPPELSVVARCLGDLHGRAVLRALPSVVERARDLRGPGFELVIALAFTERLVQLLHLGERLGRGEVEQVLFEGRRIYVVRHVVFDGRLDRSRGVCEYGSNGLQKVGGDVFEQFGVPVVRLPGRHAPDERLVPRREGFSIGCPVLRGLREKSVSVRTVFRTFPILPLPVAAGRKEPLLLLADHGDSERVPNPLRIDVVILGRLVSHLPEFLQVHLLGDLQPQARFEEADGGQCRENLPVERGLDQPLVGLHDGLHELGAALLLRTVAVLGVLTEHGRQVEQRELLVAGRNEIFIDIAVRGYTLCELEILRRVDDEIGRRSDLAHHRFGPLQHFVVSGVRLHDARRYAEYLAQLTPAGEGELLDQHIRHGLVEQPEVAFARVDLDEPAAELRQKSIIHRLRTFGVGVEFPDFGRHVLTRHEVGHDRSGRIIVELDERVVEKLRFDDQFDEVLVQARILELLRLGLVLAAVHLQFELRALAFADAENRHLRGHQRIVDHLREKPLQQHLLRFIGTRRLQAGTLPVGDVLAGHGFLPPDDAANDPRIVPASGLSFHLGGCLRSGCRLCFISDLFH